MATAEQIAALKAYLRAPSDDGLNDAYDTGAALVSGVVGSHTADVPAVVIAQCNLKAAAELFHQRNAPQGVAQFADQTGAVVRVARDPLVGCYPLLRPFLPLAIG